MSSSKSSGGQSSRKSGMAWRDWSRVRGRGFLASRVGRIAVVVVAFGLFAASAVAQNAPARPDDATVEDAYVYLLGRALVVRQERMDRGAPGFAYNVIKYNPIGEADWVNPNLDTAY